MDGQQGDYKNIPSGMTKLDQWVCFQLEPNRDKPGKLNKVPKNPRTGGSASTTNPKTWGTFAQALEGKMRFRLDGIGFVLTAGFIGIDIDDCVHDGVISPEALKIIDLMDSYTEISFHRTGVHIIGYGRKPEGFKKCKARNFDGRGSDLEVYDSGRYFTVTGESI